MPGVQGPAKRWRAVLLSALVVIALGLPCAPVARAGVATATLAVTSTWQDGFIARFTVTNFSAVPMADWRLEFDMPASEGISHAWSGTVARSGTHYVLGPVNWNRIIAPGGTATGGFRGVLAGAFSPPVNCVLNRQYRCS